MADYIYLLETRLTGPQQRALGTVRSVARDGEYTVFLTGGAVRDMTGGGPVRDLDLTVQGNALLLRPALEAAGAEVYGEHEPSQRLFLRLPGGVRVEVASAMAATFPTPGKPVYQPATLIEALRSRDFTANAMAISLNDGSYGLLMDPLNGVADIENRELRLVSNYGFIEDPSRLIRAARLRARLGWQLEERTAQRYEAAKEEGYMKALSAWNRGYELEEIFHEEDPVRVLNALESEGWLSSLTPTLHANKANTTALNDVAERQGQLMMQGLAAQSAAISFPLVTAKMSQAEVADLKKLFVRRGFLDEIESLEARTRDFANQLAGKDLAAPSAVWRMLHAAEPNLVLSAAYSSKSSVLQARLKTFLNDSPGARGRIPYVQMQEMRITPDLPGYDELIETLFFELMDNKLSTPEEMKAFLEPYSPPAPPPPLNLRRARAKKEARPSRAKGKKAADVEEMPLSVAAEEEAAGVATGIMEPGTLTGPDRGSEPTSNEPLEGVVAPEPSQVVGAVQPTPVRKPAPQSSAKQVEKTAAASQQDLSKADAGLAKGTKAEAAPVATSVPVKLDKAEAKSTAAKAPTVTVAPAGHGAKSTSSKEISKSLGSEAKSKPAPKATAEGKQATGKSAVAAESSRNAPSSTSARKTSAATQVKSAPAAKGAKSVTGKGKTSTKQTAPAKSVKTAAKQPVKTPAKMTKQTGKAVAPPKAAAKKTAAPKAAKSGIAKTAVKGKPPVKAAAKKSARR